MKIEWKRVTWYSKALAMAVFIIVPIIAFYLGMKYDALLYRTGLPYNFQTQGQANDSAWESVKLAVASCRAERTFQNHSRLVSVELKNGVKLSAFEPAIDDIVNLVTEAEPNCGHIPVATE